MEKLFYESRPYFFGLLSTGLMFAGYNTPLMKGSCLILLLASATAIYLRYQYRSARF